MIHIHPSERMMERGQETDRGKVRRVKWLLEMEDRSL